MDILCTFEDGTTELRAANSPALDDAGPHAEDRWPQWTVADVVEIEQTSWQAADRHMVLVFRKGLDTGIYLGPRNGSKVNRRGWYAHELRRFQGWRGGQKNEPITPLAWTEQWGWRPCKVETTDEQIARLQREAKALDADVRRFIRDVATNWDHDEDGHRYQTGCRVCAAEALLRRVT